MRSWGLFALTSVGVCLRTEVLSISLQTISHSITYSLHHWDYRVYAESTLAQMTCLRRRNTIVAFRLLALSLEEYWNKPSKREDCGEIERKATR